MAMSKASMRAKIIAKINDCNVNMDAATEAIVNACLEAFCDGIIEEINDNATITMDDSDFNVIPGSFEDSLTNPITGEGDNKSFSLTGKIS